ncbi:MAG: hypothetical protein J6M95_03050 [Bacilli bacterium]|nr:hypothetical protein [Bacilli bacterium]
MKKKALLLASIGALVCTVGITALAVGRANHLDAFAVKADPVEYSVTFDENNTTVEAVDDHWVFSKTTPRGAKVGVVGFNAGIECFSFHNKIFTELHLADFTSTLVNAGAYEFSNITGFAISFSGDESGMTFSEIEDHINKQAHK